MKKLIFIFLAVASILCADDYDRFMVTRRVKYPDGTFGYERVAYAWLEVPIAMMKTKIPQAALDKVHGKDNNGKSKVTSMNLQEFSLSSSDFGNVSIFALSANESVGGTKWRRLWTTKEDLITWVTYINAYGYTIEDVMDREQYHARIAELTQ